MARHLGDLSRAHWPFALVLAAGAALRIGATIAYSPALFYPDSWGYLSASHGPGLVTLTPIRPAGYAVALSILPGELRATVVLQHLGGLLGGGLIYALLLRLGAGRLAATAGAALILLDAWAIALEQHILAEAFFTFLLVAGVVIALWRPKPGWAFYSATGALLAAATLMRPVGLAAGAVFIMWLLYIRPGGRALAAGAAAFVVPVLAYSAAHAAATGTFGLSQADGWFLYGRVGEIATCDEIRSRLCTNAPGEGPNHFIFAKDSPARVVYGPMSTKSERQAYTNRKLREFAMRVIRERPLAYAEIVARDFLRYLRPGPRSGYREDNTIMLPKRRNRIVEEDPVRELLYPDLMPQTRPPARALNALSKVAHTSRVVLAACVLLALAALALRRLPPRQANAVVLLLGVALGMLLLNAMTSGFALRYLVPEVPLLIAAGALGGRAVISDRKASVFPPQAS